MTIAELLEQDKENLTAALAGARTPDRAEAVIEKEFDRLLYRYNEQCENEVGRTACARMIQTARTETGLVDSVGETKIWESNAVHKQGKEKKHSMSLLLLVIGAACLIFGIALLIGNSGFREFFSLPLQLLFIIGGGALLYLAGYLRGRPVKDKDEPKEQKIEMIVDAGRIYRCLQAVALTMDQNIQSAEQAGEEDPLADGSRLPADREEIELMAGLLEAACSGDGQYALDKLNDVRYFLHKKGVEAVEYSPDTENYFDRIPSRKTGTIRPALVSGGKLLKKGLAAGGEP